jgi:hypothetical protein
VGVQVGDIAPQFGYADPNNPNLRYTLSYTDNFVVPLGTTNWRGESNYNAGLPKQNNKGVVDSRTPQVRSTNAPQAAANNFATGNASVTGLYRQFYGSTATDITTSAEVRGLSNSVFTNVNTISSVSITQLKFVIAIPTTRNLVSVITSNFENITTSFVQTNFNVDDAGGNPVAYKIFTISFFTVPSFTITINLS